MRIVITGSAGFIGYHVAAALLAAGHYVVGVDGFTPYYDQQLKEARHARLTSHPRFVGHRLMLEDDPALARVFDDAKIDAVVHLAGQAGVRYSIENPRAYVDSNIVGTFNLLERIRAHPVGHLLIASTSSVYGANVSMPFAESDTVAHPMTLYAASKVATEAMAHSYSHLFDIPVTVFRFFTVYGPWGRPDMAYFKFTHAILEGSPIDVYNGGRMSRDFTYIDDLVASITALVPLAPRRPAAPVVGEIAAPPSGRSPVAPYRILNLGRGAPVTLMSFIGSLERVLAREAVKTMLPMQPGDVPDTFASSVDRIALLGPQEETPLDTGLRAFVDWYRDYYRV